MQASIVRWFDITYYVILIAAILFTVAISIDLLFDMGWGYSYKELSISVGLVFFTFLVHKIGLAIFRLVGIKI